jgi:hypothetical protein
MCVPASSVYRFLSSHHAIIACYFKLTYFGSGLSDWGEAVSVVVLLCVTLMAKDAQHFFIFFFGHLYFFF